MKSPGLGSKPRFPGDWAASRVSPGNESLAELVDS
jgi:hypothetical protein